MSRLYTRWSAYLFAAVAAVGLIRSASAQESPVTLREAVDLFVQNNLELQEGRLQAEEFAALARQAAAYPNPTGLVTHEPTWRSGESHSETYFNLSQRVEWPRLRRARVRAADQLADAAFAELQADSLRLLFEVTEAYTLAISASQHRDILQTVTEIFRQADRASEVMLAQGETSGYRVRRLRIERARYENHLALAELEGADARRRLALLIQPQSEVHQVYPAESLRDIPTDIVLESVLTRARAQRAELESARAEVDAAQASLLLTRQERLPEPTFTAGFKRQSDGFNGVFLGTSVPIPLFDRNTGAIQARQERLWAARTRLSLVETRIDQDVRRSYETYASLSERVDLISQGLLGDSDELLHAARVGYNEGEMTLVELLDAAEAYRDARVSSLNLLSELQIAYFDLLRAAGGSIDDASFTASQ